jgi:hypothetical protein
MLPSGTLFTVDSLPLGDKTILYKLQMYFGGIIAPFSQTVGSYGQHNWPEK